MKKLLLTCLVVLYLLPGALLAQILRQQAPFYGSEQYEHLFADTYWQSLRLPEAKVTDDPGLFAFPVEVQFAIQESGQWVTLPNGDRVWYLLLEAEQAAGISVLFDEFDLPRGSRLHLMSPDGAYQLGAYTFLDEPQEGKWASDFLPGNQILLEYYEPFYVREDVRLSIFRVDVVPEGKTLNPPPSFGFGTADPCNININCPEGTDWQLEKKGVCRIRMVLEEGTGWCSGSLINNVNNNGTPYVLSGFHCQDGFTPIYDMWRFDFHYESDQCSNPPGEPPFYSLTGCIQVAGKQESDFLLLEINETVPDAWNVYFNGWDRSAGTADSTVFIHHASGDIKKISIDQQAPLIHPTPLNWNNGVITPANFHFRVTFDEGTFEPGSSGGPLFNEDGRIVAQLHGGILDCDQVVTYHGRFFRSWDEGNIAAERLQDWLDPNDSGVMELDGYNPPQPVHATLAGRLITEDGTGIPNVQVICSGGFQDTVWTDNAGDYLFEALPVGQGYTLNFRRQDEVDNGVTTLDMVFMKRHILTIDTLATPYRIIAGDVNFNNSMSTLDMVLIQRAILGIDDSFSDDSEWRFIPAAFQFPNPADPFDTNFPSVLDIPSLDGDILDADMIGCKLGDANSSISP